MFEKELIPLQIAYTGVFEADSSSIEITEGRESNFKIKKQPIHPFMAAEFGITSELKQV